MACEKWLLIGRAVINPFLFSRELVFGAASSAAEEKEGFHAYGRSVDLK